MASKLQPEDKAVALGATSKTFARATHGYRLKADMWLMQAKDRTGRKAAAAAVTTT